MKRCERSSAPLDSGSAASRDQPTHRQLTAKGGELLRGPTTTCVDRSLAVPDELLRQGTEPAKAAAHAEEQVGRLLGEHKRASQRPRIAELGSHHPAPAGLAVADRDLVARLDRKSTRLNSSHTVISYAVFCLKKKKK